MNSENNGNNGHRIAFHDFIHPQSRRQISLIGSLVPDHGLGHNPNTVRGKYITHNNIHVILVIMSMKVFYPQFPGVYGSYFGLVSASDCRMYGRSEEGVTWV